MAPRTVPEALQSIFGRYGSQIAFVDKQAFYRQTWTYSQTAGRIDAVASFLIGRGLKPGDSVAICAPNSPWWLMVYLACAKLGIIVVPLDFNSSAEFMDTVLHQINCKLLCKSVYKLYDGLIDDILIEDMAHLLPADSPAISDWPALTAETALEIVFTSGSTGTPKGVVLTHGNVMSNVANFLEAWPRESRHQTNLSLVPLSHMLEQTAGFWAPFSMGYTTVYIASLRPTAIAAALQEERITGVITVPAFLQLLRRRIESQISTDTFSGKLAQSLLWAGRKTPRRLSRILTLPIRRRLGSQLATVAVGGAALPADVEDFWQGMGYHVIQGYGLTETSPLATYSNRRDTKLRSVGRGLPGQELQLGPGGELLLRGPHVFKGYYDNDTATNAVLDAEGWLHTGDIAEIDSKGFVFLKGRLKNMLLGSNGLNIYPEDIEAKLLNFSQIRDVVVLIDNHGDEPKLTAVVLTNDDEATLQHVIKTVNQSLASHQTIQKHIIWPDSDFPRTPTRKVRRKDIQEAVDSRRTDEPFVPSHDSNVIHSILQQVAGNPRSITGDLVLASDLGIDSIKRLELVTLIEEKLLVAVDETEITQSTTVGQLSQTVEGARHSRSKKQSGKRQLVTANPFILFAQSVVQAVLVGIVGSWQRLECGTKFNVTEPVIYVANHTSHLDAVTFMRLAGFRGRQRLVVAAAADYFFNTRIKSWLARNILHAVPVERDGAVRQSLERIGAELSRGRSVIIFPEGSRSSDGQITSFKSGIGLLATALQVSVVPVKIQGNYKLLPKGKHWPKRGRVSVIIGQPVYYSVAQTPEAVAADLQRLVEAL